MLRALFTAFAAIALTGCTGLFFQPMQPWVRTPADIGLQYEDVRIPTQDGLSLSAWYLPARQEAKGTILFLHGNAENISTHIGAVHWLPERGFNVLLLDYRGYGASEGTPSVAGAQEDIDSAMRYLLARDDIDRNRIVVLAQSLGGALGLHYVAHSAYRQHVRGTIIDSAFIGYRDTAREKLRSASITRPLAWPLGLTVTSDYRPLDAAPMISPIPLLFIHGDDDIVIPVQQGRQLFEAAREPKALWVISDAGHIQSLDRPDVRERLVAWLHERLGE